jgi:hypothetical protein
MKTNIKKSIKLVTLLVTSILIATASAQTYTYMYLSGSITVGAQKIVWIKEGQEVSGDTVQMSFTVEPGVTRTFNDMLYLKNKDETGHTVNITVTNTVGSHFETCTVYVYENFTQSGSWTLVGTLDLKNSNSALTNKQLNSASYFKFDFEIRATSTGSDNDFELMVIYE